MSLKKMLSSMSRNELEAYTLGLARENDVLKGKIRQVLLILESKSNEMVRIVVKDDGGRN